MKTISISSLKSKVLRGAVGVALASSLLLTSNAFAANKTWNGSSSSNWGNANWSPSNFVNGDDVFFGVAPNQGNTFLGGARTVNSVTFNSGAVATVIGLQTNNTTSPGNATLTVNSGGSINVLAGNTVKNQFGNDLASGFVQVTAGTTLTIAHNGTGDLTFVRPIRGTGITVDKTGTGRLIFTGNAAANAFTGTLSITNGLFGGTVGPSANGAATFIRTGAVHSPGLTAATGSTSAAGIQAFTGDLAYDSGSALSWQLNNNVTGATTGGTGVRGTDFDGINVNNVTGPPVITGTLSISTGVTSNLVFNALGSTVDFSNAFWSTNQSWLVYSNTNAPTLASGNIFDAINVSNDSLGNSLLLARPTASFSWVQSGNNVNLVYAVPEPGTIVMLMGGLGSLIAFRRRSRD